MKLKWLWRQINLIPGQAMHEILSERQKVFTVEQKCIYLDADELDIPSWHLTGYDAKGKLAAYARVCPPGSKHVNPTFGRLMVKKAHRSEGLGKLVVQYCILKCKAEYPTMDILISAQSYILGFYEEFGFGAISKPYDDEGIEHVDMLLVSKKLKINNTNNAAGITGDGL